MFSNVHRMSDKRANKTTKLRNPCRWKLGPSSIIKGSLRSEVFIQTALIDYNSDYQLCAFSDMPLCEAYWFRFVIATFHPADCNKNSLAQIQLLQRLIRNDFSQLSQFNFSSISDAWIAFLVGKIYDWFYLRCEITKWML